MKRDGRRSQFFNPRRAVGVYTEKAAQALCGWYDFNVAGGESVSINNFAFDLAVDQTRSVASYESLPNPDTGVSAPFQPAWFSPYKGKSTVRSAFLPGENYSNFKIAFNGGLPNPAPQNHSTSVVRQRDNRTYSFWIALPDLNQTIPDTEICIATKVRSSSTFASFGEWKLTYNTTTDSLSWVEKAEDVSKAVISRTTNSRAFNKGSSATSGLPRDNSGNYGGDISGGQWFNVVLVVGDMSGGESRIFINGMNATATATKFLSPLNFLNLDTDIILGSGPNAPSIASGNEEQFNSIYINSFFAWNVNLNINQIRFLYDNYKFFIGSGNVSRQPRNAIQDLDNLGGSYPQIKNSSDQNRLGNKTPFFDDKLTYNYGHQSQTIAGLMLGADSMFISSGIASPNEPPSITLESKKAVYKWGFRDDGDTNKITVANLNNLSVFLTDSNGKAVEFYSDSTYSTVSRYSANLYIVPLGHLAATSTPTQVAAPWAQTVAFAHSYGDIAISSTHITDSNGHPTPDIMWTQQIGGFSGNTAVTGSLITLSAISGVPHNTDTPWIPYNPAGLVTPVTTFGIVSGSTHFYAGQGGNDIKVRKGTSDSFYPFQYESIFNSAQDDYAPYKDNKQTSFSRRGFDSIPGFNSPMQDKDSFQIDISSKTDGPYGTRWSKKWDWTDNPRNDGGGVPMGDFAGKDKTGFQYYDWYNQSWVEIGHSGSNVAFLSGSRPCHTDISVAGADVPRPSRQHQQVGEGGVTEIRRWYPLDKQYLRSGSDYSLRQFAPPFFPCRLDPEIYSEADISGSLRQLKNMGVPTISNFGPSSTKYFARKHNRISLKDYINSPFLVEEIKVSVPVRVRREYRAFAQDFSQSPMDLYTFFLYRQETLGYPDMPVSQGGAPIPPSPGAPALGSFKSRQQIKDLMEVDYSNRYIVASASIIAYSDTWHQGPPNLRTAGWRSGFGDVLKTFTSPAATIDFKTQISASTDWPGSNPVAHTYTVEKTLDFTFRPGVTGEIFSTHTAVTSSNAMDDVTGKLRYPGIPCILRSYMTMSNQSSDLPYWWTGPMENNYGVFVPDDCPRDESWAIINHYWPGGTTTAPLTGSWEGARPIPGAVEINHIGYAGGRYAGLPVWNKAQDDPDTTGGFKQWDMAARGHRCGIAPRGTSPTFNGRAYGYDTQSPFPGDNTYASSSGGDDDGRVGICGAGANYNRYLWGTAVDNSTPSFTTFDDSKKYGTPPMPGVAAPDGTGTGRLVSGLPSKWVQHGRARPMWANYVGIVPVNNSYSGSYAYYIPASSSVGGAPTGSVKTRGGNMGLTSQLFNPKNVDPRATLGSFGVPRAGTMFVSGSTPTVERSYVLANDEGTTTSTETSYLLFPEDDLVFGLDCSPGIPHTLFQDAGKEKIGPGSITGSYMQIRQGEATITFYGSYVKDQKQKYPSYSQNLTTANVHEVISNGDILDEWLINPDKNYLGSSLGQFVTGSMLNNRGITRSIRKANLDDISTVRTITRYVDDKEMIYDTMLPSLSGAWQADIPYAGDTGIYAQCQFTRNDEDAVPMDSGNQQTVLNFLMIGSDGGTLGGPTGRWGRATNSSLGKLYNGTAPIETGEKTDVPIPGNSYRYTNFGNGDSQDPISPGNTVTYTWEWGPSAINPTEYANYANPAWPFSFPYEPRYTPSMRTLSTNLRDLVVGRPITANGYLPTIGHETGSIYGGAYYNLRNPYANNEAAGVLTRYMNSNCAPAIIASSSGAGIQRMVQVVGARGDKAADFYSPNDTYRSTALALFGVGEMGQGTRGSGKTLTLNKISGSTAQKNSLFNKPHGFKYGLYNALPQRTSAVFRSDKYGQFSDMLQQREYTRYADLEIERLTYDMPIQIQFVKPLFETDGKMSLVSPQSTNSSNLSRFATSSLPFFEDTVRNRGPVDVEAASVTVTVS